MEVEPNIVWPFSVKRMLKSQPDVAADDEHSTSSAAKASAKKKKKKGGKKKSFKKKLEDVSSSVSSERRDSSATKDDSSSSKLSLSFRKDKRKQAVKELLKAFDAPLIVADAEQPFRSEWMRFAMYEPSIQSILGVFEPLNPP